MTTSRSSVLVCLLATLASGCAMPFMKKPPPPPAAPPVTITAPAETKVKASMTLAAGADVNPNANGRPSPVTLRIYQLKAEAAFQDSQFNPLYDDDRKALGETLLTRDDITLAPGEKKTLEVSLAPDTRFVGVFAEFHGALGSGTRWHAVVPAPRKNLLVTVTGKHVSLTGTE